MMKLKLACILGPVEVALLSAAPLSQAQPIADFYRITDSVSRNRMEYHRDYTQSVPDVSLAPGQPGPFPAVAESPNPEPAQQRHAYQWRRR
jgi:hypothetical protein